MNAPAIPRVKEVLRRLTLAEAKQLAQQALTMENAAQVRAFMKERLKE